MKRIVAIILALCLLMSFSVLVQAADREVTLNRVIQVSDTHLIMEFSEPIAFALKESADPWVSIRAVKPGQSNPQKGDDGTTYLQWQIALMFLDGKHDRVLGTLAGSSFGVKSISDILGWKGELAKYASRGWEMQLILEEKNAADNGDGGKDGKVCNITSADGTVMLSAVQSGGYESARMAIEVDKSYAYDTSKVEPVREISESEADKDVFPYQDGWLTVKRAVQVSKNQIIVEFSEPIAVGLTQSRGPFIALRLVPKRGNGAIRSDDDMVYLQWEFGTQYVDSKHDRLLLTMSKSVLQITDIDDIRNYRGELARYANRGWELRLVIEEYPDNKTDYSDCGVCNITTPDGSKMLFPTHVNGYEAVSLLVERDLNYVFDPGYAESTRINTALTADTIVMMDGAEYIQQQEESDKQVIVKTIEIIQNNPLVIAILLGGCVLVGVGVLAFVFITGKKRKAAK